MLLLLLWLWLWLLHGAMPHALLNIPLTRGLRGPMANNLGTWHGTTTAGSSHLSTSRHSKATPSRCIRHRTTSRACCTSGLSTRHQHTGLPVIWSHSPYN